VAMLALGIADERRRVGGAPCPLGVADGAGTVTRTPAPYVLLHGIVIPLRRWRCTRSPPATRTLATPLARREVFSDAGLPAHRRWNGHLPRFRAPALSCYWHYDILFVSSHV